LNVRRSAAAIGVLLVATIALAGPASAASVSAVEYSFVPSTVTIGVGQSVTWTNRGRMAHTSTSDRGLWDSGSLSPGQSFTFTYRSAGTFSYHCQFHAPLGMRGIVVVRAQATSPSSGLPRTGSSFGPLIGVGVAFLVSGGAILFGLRRRRT
jgi:LPXTG-motif cell wall-anchored protein